MTVDLQKLRKRAEQELPLGQVVLDPVDLLCLLDRLERAEQKLAERESVYPTVMTQVGKEP